MSTGVEQRDHRGRPVRVLLIALVLPCLPLVDQRGPLNPMFTVNGVQRSALVFPSSAKPPESGVPIVFVYHGHGGTAEGAARFFGIERWWPEAVTVYMQGLPVVGGQRGRTPRFGWERRPGARKSREVRYFDAVLEWVQHRYRVDPARIYATGFSSGGDAVYELWSVRTEVVAAFAIDAAISGPELQRTKPKPALLIAGQRDRILPFSRQMGNTDRIREINHCEAEGIEWANGCRLYPSKIGGDVVTCLHPGAHAIPPDAGELIVRFFHEHPMP